MTGKLGRVGGMVALAEQSVRWCGWSIVTSRTLIGGRTCVGVKSLSGCLPTDGGGPRGRRTLLEGSVVAAPGPRVAPGEILDPLDRAVAGLWYCSLPKGTALKLMVRWWIA